MATDMKMQLQVENTGDGGRLILKSGTASNLTSRRNWQASVTREGISS
jgi:hypothetical protein